MVGFLTLILAAVIKKRKKRVHLVATIFRKLVGDPAVCVRHKTETLASLLLPSWPKITREKEEFLFSFCWLNNSAAVEEQLLFLICQIEHIKL